MEEKKFITLAISFSIGMIIGIIFVYSYIFRTEGDGKKMFTGKANIKCYSGNALIYEGISGGKVLYKKNSGIIYFIERHGKMLEIKANCVISYMH